MEVLKQESDFPALTLTSFVENKLKFGETGGRDIIVWMWCFYYDSNILPEFDA